MYRNLRLIIIFVCFFLGCLLRVSAIQDVLVNHLILLFSVLTKENVMLPALWKDMLCDCSVALYCSGLLVLGTMISETQLCRRWYSERKEKVDLFFCIFISLFFLGLFVSPFVLFGEDSVVTIHDNLDDSVPRFSYIHEHHLLWKFDETIPVMNGISTIFFNREGFSLYNFVYCLFPTYVGYVLNYTICILLGFFSMFSFQKTLFKNGNVIILVLTSWAYALLPSICSYKMALASLPLAALVFYNLITKKEKKWLVLSFFIPFLSELSGVGIFLCGTWLLFCALICLKQRKFNLYLIVAWLLLVAGYCAVNFHLIYIRFVVAEPLNRDYFVILPESFLRSFMTYFFSAHYHAPTLQNRLIVWLVLGVGLVSVFKYLKSKKQEIGLENNVLLFCLIVCFGCAFMASLSESQIVNKVVKIICPPLAGVSFTRIYTIGRLFWYVAFSAGLLYIGKNKKYRTTAYALALLQILFIFVGNSGPMCTYYYDSKPSWSKNLFGGTEISWRDFYSKTLFEKIKRDINYQGENVAAVGFHPGVLLYNNFNTIDGYISFYPYKEQVLWHDLMLPEFERNKWAMDYFDSWSGRRYVYNKEIDYQPTRRKNVRGVSLMINMNILRNTYKCRYIISRAKINNVSELAIKLKKNYKDIFYDIWIYEIIY